jgi:DHA3 family tetracycline resistance protein-like MFS transporter
MSAISAIYRIDAAGLGPLELVLVGTTLEVAVLVAEVPTGIVADLYSRRLSVVIGYFLIGAGFMLEGAIAEFPTILLAQVLWGTGYAFTSGARQAWLTDEAGQERAARAFMRSAQAGQAGALIGIFVSIGIGTVDLALPILLGGAFFVAMGVVSWFCMAEEHYTPVPRGDRTTWGSMAAQFQAGVRIVRSRPVLVWLMVIGLFFGLWSEAFDRMWTLHLLDNVGLPPLGGLDRLWWFAIIQAGGMLLSIGAVQVVSRVYDHRRPGQAVRFLIIANACLVISLLLLGLANTFALALIAVWGVDVFRRVQGPIALSFANRQIESQSRATVLSMLGQIDSAGQMVGGPALGAIGSAHGVRAALVVAAGLLAPVVPLYQRLGRRTQVAASAAAT